MSAASITLSRTLNFYQASIGKKVVMAVTGCMLFLFVIGHMLGNLQIYLGADQLNHYGEKLHSMGGLLARVYASGNYNPKYIRAENFSRGDIHRLITGVVQLDPVAPGGVGEQGIRDDDARARGSELSWQAASMLE